MTTAIRKHLRDFIAIAVLVVVGLVATVIIVQQQRLRIPILEPKPFERAAITLEIPPRHAILRADD